MSKPKTIKATDTIVMRCVTTGKILQVEDEPTGEMDAPVIWCNPTKQIRLPHKSSEIIAKIKIDLLDYHNEGDLFGVRKNSDVYQIQEIMRDGEVIFGPDDVDYIFGDTGW